MLEVLDTLGCGIIGVEGYSALIRDFTPSLGLLSVLRGNQLSAFILTKLVFTLREAVEWLVHVLYATIHA